MRFFARTEVALCSLSQFNADFADASSICAVVVIGDRPIVATFVVLKANEKNNDNVKGKIESAIKYIRGNFWPLRTFTDIGDMRLAKDYAVSDNLVIDIVGDRLRMDFTANNLMGKVISISNTINADKLNIDRLLASMRVEKKDSAHPPDKTPTKIPDKTPKKTEEYGPFDIPVQLRGEVWVTHAIFRGLAVKNFDLQYLFKYNVLTVNHLHGNVAGGKISRTAKAQLKRKPIAYTADISVEQTRAEIILNTRRLEVLEFESLKGYSKIRFGESLTSV